MLWSTDNHNKQIMFFLKMLYTIGIATYRKIKETAVTLSL